MRHLIILAYFGIVPSLWADPSDPLYLAVRTGITTSTIIEFHAVSRPVTPTGMQLIPWADLTQPDLAPRPGKHRRVNHYRLNGDTIERRPDTEIDAEDTILRQEQ